MGDLIRRSDVIELIKNSYYNLAESMEDTWAMIEDVERLPSVQASCKQVTGKLDERKIGHWIDREHCQVDEDGYDVAFCSVCGQEVTLAPWGDAFCPCCGSYNGG